MQTVTNLLVGDEFSFLGSTGNWVVNTPHTIASNKLQSKFSELASLRIAVASSTDITLVSPKIPVNDEWGWDSKGFVWVYPEQSTTVTVAVTAYTPAPMTVSASTFARADQWTLCLVDGPTPTEGGNISMTVGMTGIPYGNAIYLQNPVIITPDQISNNIFNGECWQRLPTFLQEADADQTDPDYPLLRFMDVLNCDCEEIFEIWDQYKYIPPEDGGLRQSTSLFDPSVANIEVLRWWAQILGVSFYDPSQGSTPWINLETELNPGGQPLWSFWESTPDANHDTVVTWAEIENFAPGVNGLLDLFRWQIETAFFGLNGGTQQAIVQAVKQVLTGTKTVVFLPLADGDAWKFRVETLVAETPDNTILGGSSASVLAIAANAVPLGYQMVHQTI